MVSGQPTTNIIIVNSGEEDDQIDSVIVFPADAEVKRRVKVVLKKGKNHIIIEHLPSCIYENSIRVGGTDNFVIFDVVYHSPQVESPPSASDLDDEIITGRRRKLESLRKERSIMKEQQEFLRSYGRTLDSQNTNIDDVEHFFDMYSSRQIATAERMQKLDAQITQVEKERDETHAKVCIDTHGVMRAAKIGITVLAETEGEAELMLTYVVFNASWTPLYDVRACIAKSPEASLTVALHYCACINQSTGENWPDIALTLSTSSPKLDSTVPQLSAWRIGLQPPSLPPSAVRSPYRRRRRPTRFLDLEAEVDEEDEEDEGEDVLPEANFCELPAMTHHRANVASSRFLNTTFGIPGRSNVPSDEGTHKVVIAVLDFPAKLEWVCVPRKRECVFLTCQLTNSSEFTLLPGEASVFVDDSFVSKTQMEHVNPNDNFKLSFGTDSALHITYPSARTLDRTITPSSLPFLAKGPKYSVAAHSQRIVVRNSRAAAVSALRILDHVPVSTDTTVDVSVLAPLGLSSTQEVASPADESTSLGKRKERPWTDVRQGAKARWADLDVGGEGMVEWMCDVGPSEEIELELAWEIKAPFGQKWTTL